MKSTPRRSPFIVLALIALVSLPGCSSRHYHVSFGGKQPIELRRQTLEDGSVITWRLPATGSDIHRSMAAVVVKPRVGLHVRTINGTTGAEYGVKAWEGVLITDVTSDSTAADAGLVQGEIVLAVGGEGLASEEEFWEVVNPLAHDAMPLSFEVLGHTNGGEGVRPRRTVELLTDEERITETRLDTYPLRTSGRVRQLTGLQLGELSSELALHVFDREGPVTLITDVVTGSPAYLAGLRRGDRIIDCEGLQNPDLDQIVAAIVARTSRRDVPENLEPLALHPADTPAARGPVSLQVVGPLGAHTADVDVIKDVDDSTEFYFPILFDWESDASNLEWSFLDFIFQFGASYDRSYSQTNGSREPKRWSKLSFFPFGMFEFESTKTRREYTFLWFISWKTEG